MTNANKVQVFFEICKLFNENLNSIPILYGSLGLSQFLDCDIEVDDIDILIEADIFTQQLRMIHQLMNQLGFTLIDKNENEFLRNTIKVGIASDGDLNEFAGIDPRRLQINRKPEKYRVLTLAQYLLCYVASNRDSYRKVQHQKNDALKIELITQQLSIQ